VKKFPLRRLSAYLAAASVVMAAGLALLPWWVAPVLRAVGRPWGAEFASYERVGYGHFILHDLHLRRPGLHVAVESIQAPTPVLWLWLRCTGQAEELVAGSWSVVVQEREKVTLTPNAMAGWLPLRGTLRHLATGLETWVPRASLGAGEVSWPGGGLQLDAATWTERSLTVPTLNFGAYHGSALLRVPADADLLHLSLHTRDNNGSARLESGAKEMTGDLLWWDQPLRLEAEYAETGWLPATGTLVAKSWQLPGAVLKLEEHYTALQGQGRIAWREGSYSAEMNVQGVARQAKGPPPFELVLKGSGDLSHFTLKSAHADLPGISMDLSAPVTFDRQGRFSHGDASFKLLADLEKQPWIAAKGTARGLATLARNANGYPLLTYTLELRDVSFATLRVGSLELRGDLQWPRLTLTHGTVQLTGSEVIEMTGAYDFSLHEWVDLRLKGTLSGKTLAAWLPAGLTFDMAKFNIEGGGPPAKWAHTGGAELAALGLPRMKPLAARLQWNGLGGRIEHFTTAFSSGSTRVDATGSLQGPELDLATLSLGVDDQECLRLAHPAVLSWRDGLSCDSLELGGQGDASLALRWAEEGALKLALHRIPSRWLNDLILLEGPAWELDSLLLEGKWDKGPMSFSAVAAATLDLGAGQSASLELDALGDKDGIQVKSLLVKEGTQLVLKAEGQLPVSLLPGSRPPQVLLGAGPLRAELSTGTGALFWRKFSELSGVEIMEPRASAHVEGTWAHPLGELRLQAARLSLNRERFGAEYPALEGLDLLLKGDDQVLTLEKLVVSVEGQAVQAQGKLPFATGAWSELWASPLSFARRGAEWSLAIPDADVASFGRFLPQFMAPKGRVTVALNSQKGGVITGTLLLHDAASRPLGALGVFQEINAELKLEGRALELRGVTAKLGGQALTLSGTVRYPQDGIPRYALLLRGENLPFVRQSGLLVRGDLDLRLESTAAGATLLAGTVGMRDSLFFSDLKTLLPRGPKGPSHQAPYFAVGRMPFAAWLLDVTLAGKSFLRVRTPVFRAVASAQFHLGGTLGEPLLVGEATLGEGQVLMPFASLTHMEGRARITEEKPHELELYMRSSGRRYNYELGMELTGSAEDPRVTFSSSPPLESEQLMLMVMTGAAPANEIVFSSSQRFARIGTYLGQTLLGNLSGDTGDSSRISVSSGEKVSRQGRETYEVQYKIGERWKWVGEYDEFDDFNLGIKWRLYPVRAREPNSH
jgi:translocation and assembly module TamB